MTGRVLGIDPSLTACAVASSAGWIDIGGHPGRRDDDHDDRLLRILAVHDQVRNVLGDVELIVIEGPAYSRSDPSAFDRAALWWLIYRTARHAEIPVAIAPPNVRAMYATGRGNAAKGAVIDAVARRWAEYETAGDDNAADAVTLLAMGLDWLGRPLCPMPATHRRALDKVAWPEMETARA